MKRKFVFLSLLLVVFIRDWACCIEDNRSLVQYLLEVKNLTVFKCRILTTSVDTNFEVTSKAQVLEVFLGKVTAKEVTLNTGNEYSSTRASHYWVGMTLLIFGNGEGAYFHCGGICDNRTQILDGSKGSENIEQTLRHFAKLITNKKSCDVRFKNEEGIPVSVGKLVKGKPKGLWKFYDNKGKLKLEYNYTNMDIKYYNTEGYLYSFQAHYADSTVSINFVDPSKGIVRMKEVDFPNDSGFVSVFYDYFPNGNLRSIEGQVNLKKSGGISSNGKTGRSVSFHENGTVRVIGEYRRDRRIGVWKWFEDDGTLTAEVDYKDGTGNQ